MRALFIFLIATFSTFSVFGQYLFEKSPVIKYKRFQNWKINEQTEQKIDFSIKISAFFSEKSSLKLRIRSIDDENKSIISIYRDGKLLQIFKGSAIGPAPKAAYLEDINGDGLSDLKVIVPGNGGCGGYNYYLLVIYLIQGEDGMFTKISFTDLMMYHVNRPERDIDGDGNFEIITQTFQSYHNHNYWVFNLYNFDKKGFINANEKANYPIMVQLLYNDT